MSNQRWHTFSNFELEGKKKKREYCRDLTDIIPFHSPESFYYLVEEKIGSNELNGPEKEWFLSILASFDSNMMHLLSLTHFEPWASNSEMKRDYTQLFPGGPQNLPIRGMIGRLMNLTEIYGEIKVRNNNKGNRGEGDYEKILQLINPQPKTEELELELNVKYYDSSFLNSTDAFLGTSSWSGYDNRAPFLEKCSGQSSPHQSGLMVSKQTGLIRWACCGETQGQTEGCWISLVPGQMYGVPVPFKIIPNSFWKTFVDDNDKVNITNEFFVGTGWKNQMKYDFLYQDIKELWEKKVANSLNDAIVEYAKQLDDNLDNGQALDQNPSKFVNELNSVNQMLGLVNEFNRVHDVSYISVNDLFHVYDVGTYFTPDLRAVLKSADGKYKVGFLPTTYVVDTAEFENFKKHLVSVNNLEGNRILVESQKLEIYLQNYKIASILAFSKLMDYQTQFKNLNILTQDTNLEFEFRRYYAYEKSIKDYQQAINNDLRRVKNKQPANLGYTLPTNLAFVIDPVKEKGFGNVLKDAKTEVEVQQLLTYLQDTSKYVNVDPSVIIPVFAKTYFDELGSDATKATNVINFTGSSPLQIPNDFGKEKSFEDEYTRLKQDCITAYTKISNDIETEQKKIFTLITVPSFSDLAKKRGFGAISKPRFVNNLQNVKNTFDNKKLDIQMRLDEAFKLYDQSRIDALNSVNTVSFTPVSNATSIQGLNDEFYKLKTLVTNDLAKYDKIRESYTNLKNWVDKLEALLVRDQKDFDAAADNTKRLNYLDAWVNVFGANKFVSKTLIPELKKLLNKDAGAKQIDTDSLKKLFDPIEIAFKDGNFQTEEQRKTAIRDAHTNYNKTVNAIATETPLDTTKVLSDAILNKSYKRMIRQLTKLNKQIANDFDVSISSRKNELLKQLRVNGHKLLYLDDVQQNLPYGKEFIVLDANTQPVVRQIIEFDKKSVIDQLISAYVPLYDTFLVQKRENTKKYNIIMNLLRIQPLGDQQLNYFIDRSKEMLNELKNMEPAIDFTTTFFKQLPKGIFVLERPINILTNDASGWISYEKKEDVKIWIKYLETVLYAAPHSHFQKLKLELDAMVHNPLKDPITSIEYMKVAVSSVLGIPNSIEKRKQSPIFHLNQILWKDNSCWMDSVFVTMFGYPNNVISKKILGATETITPLHQVNFKNGTPPMVIANKNRPKCTEDEIRRLDENLKKDIIKVQSPLQPGGTSEVFCSRLNWGLCNEGDNVVLNKENSYELVLSTIAKVYETTLNNTLHIQNYLTSTKNDGFDLDIKIDPAFKNANMVCVNLTYPTFDPNVVPPVEEIETLSIRQSVSHILTGMVVKIPGHFISYMLDISSDQWYEIDILTSTRSPKIEFNGVFDIIGNRRTKFPVMLVYQLKTDVQQLIDDFNKNKVPEVPIVTKINDKGINIVKDDTLTTKEFEVFYTGMVSLNLISEDSQVLQYLAYKSIDKEKAEIIYKLMPDTAKQVVGVKPSLDIVKDDSLLPKEFAVYYGSMATLNLFSLKSQFDQFYQYYKIDKNMEKAAIVASFMPDKYKNLFINEFKILK